MAQPNDTEREKAAEIVAAYFDDPAADDESLQRAIESALVSARVEAERPDEVSAALAEMREMFPDWTGTIVHRASTDYPQTFQLTITQFEPPSEIPCKYSQTTTTLAEAMAKVREWRNQNPVQGKE